MVHNINIEEKVIYVKLTFNEYKIRKKKHLIKNLPFK